MRSLLPQPGGFEGRLLVRVGPPPNDLGAANREHQPIGRYVGRDGAVPPPLPLVADEQHHLITPVHHVLDLEVEIAPRREPVPPVAPDALDAVLDAGSGWGYAGRAPRAPSAP